MKFRFSLFSVLLLSLVALLAACKKEKDTAPDYAVQDEATIKQYIQDKNLTGFQRDTLGVYIAITQPGTGAKAKKDQLVKVLYTGTKLDGTVFDSNLTTLGFPFLLGQGRVITGWDAAFTRLNKGAKATLLIPSGLAYGALGSGAKVGPNTILRFDVEVIDIK